MTSTIISTNGKRIETRCNPSNYRVRCSKTGEWQSDGDGLVRFSVVVLESDYPEWDPAILFLYCEDGGGLHFTGIQDSAFLFEIDLVARQLIRDAETCLKQELAEDLEA